MKIESKYTIENRWNIILTGNYGVGKDTIASILNYIAYKDIQKEKNEDYLNFEDFQNLPSKNKPFNEVAFADSVKDLYKEIYNVSTEDIEKGKRDNNNDVRYKIINLAQSCKKIIGNKIWIDLLKPKLKTKNIIKDLRFKNEYKFSKRLPNKIILGIVSNLDELFPMSKYCDYIFINKKEGLDKLEEDLVNFLNKKYIKLN